MYCRSQCTSLHESQSGQHSLLHLLSLFGLPACVLAGDSPGRCAYRKIATTDADCRSAIVFRLTLLFSNPIEEIDLYRLYLGWRSHARGVNPFRYSPQQVLAAQRRRICLPISRGSSLGATARPKCGKSWPRAFWRVADDLPARQQAMFSLAAA